MNRKIAATLSLTLLSLCCGGGLARADAAADAAERCDRAAGDRYDADVRPGTRPAGPRGIDTAVALPACRDAVAAHPDDRRLQYQYGGALMWAGSRDEAKPWLERAFAAGDDRAALRLGFLFESSTSALQDLAAARRWYRKGADAGNVPAMVNLGRMYGQGIGGGKDVEAARVAYAAAAAKGDRLAKSRLEDLEKE